MAALTPDPPAWASEKAETILDLLHVSYERDAGVHRYLARRLAETHEAGRREMSDAVAALMQAHLDVAPRFGWETRILAVAQRLHRLQRRAEEAEALVAQLRKQGTRESL